MRILVVGGGAREHALVWTLARDGGHELICAPGNPGIEPLARCEPVEAGDPPALLQLALQSKVDLTVVGPELPLSRGIVDLFTARGLTILGPTRAAAALEWSKVFAKDFMARHAVPTARFRVCQSAADALARIAESELGYPLVVKADGLAAGKGVVIAEDRAAAETAVQHMMLEKRFGAAGDRIVLEEFLVGQEASYFVLCDGAHFVPFSSAQDHKRIFDNDAGPNTGGMGAFAPSPLVSAAIRQRVDDEIVRPVLAGMAKDGCPYRGFLYVGLMITAAGPRVIEFNVRFGDPEAQVVLPILDEPLAPWLDAAARGNLPGRLARFRAEPHVGVVLAAAGYPEHPQSGHRIDGLDAASRVEDAMVFHAGTRRQDGDVVTSGGRVLTVVGRGSTYEDAIAAAYRAVATIAFDGMQYRRDIGRKAIGTPAPANGPAISTAAT